MKQCLAFKEDISLYYYGALDKEKIETFEAHMKECIHCREAFERTKRLLDSISEARLPEQGQDFWQDYDKTLRARLKRPSVFPRAVMVRRLAAALLLIVGAFVVVRLRAPIKETEPFHQAMIAQKAQRVAAEESVNDEVIDEALEDELFLQELALLSELNEELDLAVTDDELLQEIRMIEEIGAS